MSLADYQARLQDYSLQPTNAAALALNSAWLGLSAAERRSVQTAANSETLAKIYCAFWRELDAFDDSTFESDAAETVREQMDLIWKQLCVECQRKLQQVEVLRQL